MKNCKDDFIKQIKNHELKCAFISYEDHNNKTCNEIVLPINFTDEELKEFLAKLDFTYDDSFRSNQYIFGTIWYKDGTWSERKDYELSEWWEYRECPTIPRRLING
jgi:hypothetical protein